MDSSTIIALCSALFTLILGILNGFWKYNQNTKDKMTDLKIEMYKQDTERKGFKRSENSAKVFGELWKVLYEIKADRVYIVQPHPLGNASFMSVQFEVKRKGVSGMKENIQQLPMEDMAVFSKALAENIFLYFTDIDKQVKDKMVKSLFAVNGCKSAAIKRMNSATDWVGNIFCEFTDDVKMDEEHIRRVLHEAATNIQFILPEFRENPFK